MSRTLKIRGDHVKFVCFPLVKKEKHNFHFFRSMYNNLIIRFSFCDIQNNHCLGKGYQPKLMALIILDITKISSDNCLLTLVMLSYDKT